MHNNIITVNAKQDTSKTVVAGHDVSISKDVFRATEML